MIDSYASAGAEQSRASAESGLRAFVQLLRVQQIGVDPTQILHDLGDDPAGFGLDLMLRTAKRLKLRARARKASVNQLEQLPLPAVAEGADGSFFLIAKAAPTEGGGVKALVQTFDRREPQVWTEDELAARWTGALLF